MNIFRGIVKTDQVFPFPEGSLENLEYLELLQSYKMILLQL